LHGITVPSYLNKNIGIDDLEGHVRGELTGPLLDEGEGAFRPPFSGIHTGLSLNGPFVIGLDLDRTAIGLSGLLVLAKSLKHDTEVESRLVGPVVTSERLFESIPCAFEVIRGNKLKASLNVSLGSAVWLGSWWDVTLRRSIRVWDRHVSGRGVIGLGVDRLIVLASNIAGRCSLISVPIVTGVFFFVDVVRCSCVSVLPSVTTR
jgi:hypothetical protein